LARREVRGTIPATVADQAGQFTSVDPDLSDTLQPYSYAAADPVVLSDPTALGRMSQGR